MTAPIPKITKKDLVYDIIKPYVHDVAAEGATITKRRLWYVLRPQFRRIPSYEVPKLDKYGNPMFDKEKKPIMITYLTGVFHQGKPVLTVNNADYSKHFNDLAESMIIDDTFISDNSRPMGIGERLPHIIIAAEKATIQDTVVRLANKFGCSYYIARGFSSIYAARELMEDIKLESYYRSKNIDDIETKDIEIVVMSDYDKSGLEIQDTIKKHFSGCDIYRALLTLEQVPADRIDDYFDESEKLGKHYELDILNIHELAETFINGIPEHLTDEIMESYEEHRRSDIQFNRISRAVNDNDELRALKEQVFELETELMKKYECAFVEADPISFDPFDVQDIYDNTVEHDVAEWLPEDDDDEA